MKQRAMIAAALSAMLLGNCLTGCGDAQGDPVPAAEVSSEQTTAQTTAAAEETTTQTSAAEEETTEQSTEQTEAHETKPAKDKGKDTDDPFVIAQNEFALNLMRETCKGHEGQNMLVSPYSVMQALAMTANGAAGQTRTEIEQTLGGLPIDSLNESFSTFQKNLPSSDDSKFQSANSIWVRENDDQIKLKPDFTQKNADYFGADTFLAPFDKSTVSEINGWCSDHTDGMIPEIISGEIPPAMKLFLINAVCFDAKWKEKYKDDPKPQDFFAANGETQTAQMMYSTEKTYLCDEHAVGFIKPYIGGSYAFAAILPEEGMTPEAYLETVTPEGLHELLAVEAERKVRAGLPKFTYDFSEELSGSLKSMGMPTAFDGHNADFSEMAELRDPLDRLFISSVLHKTHIEVDKKGTRAAAVTKVEMRMNVSIETIEEVILDRPFVYMIIENKTKLPVFIGILNEIP